MLKVYFEYGDYITFESQYQFAKWYQKLDEYVCFQIVYCDEFGRELVRY